MDELRFAWTKIKLRPYRFLGIWFVTLWVFFYVTNISLFTEILQSPVLSVSDKISFLVDSFNNIFRYLDDPRVLSVVVFSLIAAINFVLMWAVFKRKQQTARSSMSSAVGSGAALIGSHCIACGGSLIAPFITTLAGSGAFFSAARVNTAIFISVAVNVVGIIVIGLATRKMIRQEIKFESMARVSFQ